MPLCPGQSFSEHFKITALGEQQKENNEKEKYISDSQSGQYAILTPIQKRHVVHRVVYFCKYFWRCNRMFLLLVLQIEPMSIYLELESHIESFYSNDILSPLAKALVGTSSTIAFWYSPRIMRELLVIHSTCLKYNFFGKRCLPLK